MKLFDRTPLQKHVIAEGVHALTGKESKQTVENMQAQWQYSRLSSASTHPCSPPLLSSLGVSSPSKDSCRPPRGKASLRDTGACGKARALS